MAKGKRKTSDAAIKQLLESGKTQRQISQIFGVSEPYISKCVRRLSANKQHEEQSPTLLVDFEDDEALKEWLSKILISGDSGTKLRTLDLVFKYFRDKPQRKGESYVTYDFKSCPYYSGGIPEKLDGRCALCKVETTNDFCDNCIKKDSYHVAITKRAWAGDRCAWCNNDRRCYVFCKKCAEELDYQRYVSPGVIAVTNEQKWEGEN